MQLLVIAGVVLAAVGLATERTWMALAGVALVLCWFARRRPRMRTAGGPGGTHLSDVVPTVPAVPTFSIGDPLTTHSTGGTCDC